MPQNTSVAKANIPSNYSRLIARELGLSTKGLPALLAGTGLRVEELLNENCLLTADQQVRIQENAILLSREPGFGLRLGQRLSPLSHGAMGFMAYSSADLRMALRAIQAFVPTRLSFARVRLTEEQARLVCELRFDYPLSESATRNFCETLAGMYCSVAEHIVGRPAKEAEFLFPYSAPPYAALYAEFLPGHSRFGGALFQISVPLALACIPNASANHQNYLLAMHQCQAMLAAMQDEAPSVETRLKQLMLSHPPGTLSETAAAAELFMSKRTLARRLSQEGTSFRAVREALLAEQAGEYLRQGELSVEAIAALLHYHDSANFRRAFRRWYGVSPQQFRARPEGDWPGASGARDPNAFLA